MSFKLYKFCQNGVLTFLSAAFSLFYLFSIAGPFSWWFGLIGSVVITVISFIPPLGIFYPVTFGIFIIIALIISYLYPSGYFLLLLVVLIQHLVRFVSLFTFTTANPQKSLMYDEAIRYGIDLDETEESF